MIWVIGGTKDSRDFLEKLVAYRNDIVVTTATEYGGKLLENLDVQVVCKKLTLDNMVDFVSQYGVDMVVDLSHPYATEVSSNAIKVCKDKSIEYFRFEREEIYFLPQKYSEFITIDKLVAYSKTLDGNVLVTLGSNNIGHFAELENLDRFYFRILPKWDMVKKCEDYGILPKNIIAMQGPFSKGMNVEMIKQYDIKYMITKKAGATGGEKEKIEAADEMGIEVIYLTRPEVDYPNLYSDLDMLCKAVVK